MKKKNTAGTTKEEANIDSFESLTKEFIKEALGNNLSKSKTIQIIQDNWNKIYLEICPLKEESSEEKEFREKAILYLNKNEENIAQYINSQCTISKYATTLLRNSCIYVLKTNGYKGYFQWDCFKEIYSEFDDIPFETSFVLEVLCAIYKAFITLEKISINDIVDIACERLNKIYVEYSHKNKSYVKLVTDWLMTYFDSQKMSKECIKFVDMYETKTKIEKFVCCLIFEVENC